MRAHDHRCAAGGLLIAAALMLAFLLPRPAMAAKGDQTLMLLVFVNDHSIGKIGEFVLRDGALFARPEELRELGFRIPPRLSETKDGLVALADLPNFSARLDRATQTLHVTAGLDALLPALLQAGVPAGKDYHVESGLGTTLNYDVIGTSVNGRQFGSGMFEAREFSPFGVLSTDALAYTGSAPSTPNSETVIRLDSTYVYSDPESMRRYRAGDFITGALSWTRSIRMGGLQVNSDFSMRPDLITFPLPEVAGSVAVPSTVDVLVNGSRALSQQIQPGPFQVQQLPVVTGAGTVQMTVTNALGQQVTTELPFYASASLLAPGLQTYSAEAGLVRQNWGVVSNDYGSAAGSATYRRGLTSYLTLEGHAEASHGLFMGGAGGVFNVANLAVVNLALAGSGGGNHSGGQVSAGIQRTGQVFNFGTQAVVASSRFGDVAAINGDPTSQLALTANAGVSLGRFGSLGGAFTAINRNMQPSVSVVSAPGLILPQQSAPLAPSFFVPVERSRMVTVSYSTQIGDVALFATGFRDFADHESTGVFVGLTIPLGSRSSASVSAQREDDKSTGQVQATQTANTIGDWGYNVLGAVDHPDHEFAQVSYMSPWALVFAGADRSGGVTTMQAEARGAVSFVDGALFPSNRIDDAFAVVDTDGVEGIRVDRENRYMGTTDSSGRFLVPDLRSFDLNRISIDPLDAPVDAVVAQTVQEVRPLDRSGVVVHFPVKPSRGALVRIVDDAGKPIPVGSVATLKSSGAAAPVGYDGEAYIVDLQAHNEVNVERRDGRRCSVTFDYKPIPGQIQAIGPLKCQAANP